MPSFISFFLTPWGAFVLAILDASLIFFLPFGIDAVVIILVARHRDLFWLYPLIAASGSTIGAAITYWIGVQVEEKGLSRFVPENRLEALKKRVNKAGAIAMGLLALLPPPLPLTPFLVTCGALEVSRWRFFVAFASARLLRFGIEGVLARQYGRRVLRIIESGPFEYAMTAFVVVAIAGTAASIVVLWQRTRAQARRGGR